MEKLSTSHVIDDGYIKKSNRKIKFVRCAKSHGPVRPKVAKNDVAVSSLTVIIIGSVNLYDEINKAAFN